MSPYYQDANVTLYHGDCLTITGWLGADVLITDPPYGTQFSAENPKGGYGRRQNAGEGPEGFTIANDGTTETRDAALSLWGSKPALLFGSPRLPDPPGEWVDRLVWDKKRPGMNGGPWRYRHESIYVSAGFERRDNETTSILVAYPEQSDHIHAKPIALMMSLVNCAPPGVIADPFSGSGSTLIAAVNQGRRAIGVECEERYCELIAKRLSNQTMAFDFGSAS
ncbi:site-specific DNA-methyltransferase (adenine-specific) [Mycolicibacterium neoaurum]|uniref:DNA methyltransferase n=1 Tax=Mycolicibacterium neoaurum TaxID=1795 RepID=UPI000562974B|nr:DNA methyltransferase [Mycolicibacterium neoaurum]SDD60887.1 site-specific DNA-methyltransferase (adenine-specific) [Mycolicibacterium neoaurum]